MCGPKPPPVRRARVVIGRRLPSGNLAVRFEDLGMFGRYPYCDEGIEPARLPKALRAEGTLAYFVSNNREELVGIEPRLRCPG